MFRFLLVGLTASLFITQQACNTRRQDAAQTADSTTAPTASGPTAGQAPDLITNRLAGLGLTRNGHWRGISLGDDFAKIRTTEQGESFERDARHVGYTVEFPNLESMDVLYYQQNGKVAAIEVDLFLNSRPSVDAYAKDLAAYFSARYGTSKPGSNGTLWQGSGNEQISLKDVSKGKDFGLKIKIVSAQETT